MRNENETLLVNLDEAKKLGEIYEDGNGFSIVKEKIGIGSFSHLVQSHLLLLNDGQSLFSHDHVQQWQRAL